jgi:hypothetical protein
MSSKSTILTVCIIETTEVDRKARPGKVIQCKLNTGHFLMIGHAMHIADLEGYLSFYGVDSPGDGKQVVEFVKNLKIPLKVRYQIRGYDETFHASVALLPHSYVNVPEELTFPNKRLSKVHFPLKAMTSLAGGRTFVGDMNGCAYLEILGIDSDFPNGRHRFAEWVVESLNKTFQYEEEVAERGG